MSDTFITVEVPPLNKEVCEATESTIREPVVQIEIKTEVIEISDGNEDEEHVPVPKKKSTQTTQEIGGLIETNNEQDTSNSRQTVRVRVDKNAAEHARLYRERHREEINKRRRYIRQREKLSQQFHTLCNTQNTIEIEIEEITHATSNQLSSDLHRQRQQQFYETHKEEIEMLKRDRKLKKNAENNLKYRERHKQEINARKKARLQLKKYLQQCEKGNEVEQISQTTSENKPSSHIQRQRRYYERHKEEINKRKRDSRLMKNISQSTPATAAERNLKYRERNKEKINERRRDNRQLKKKVQQSEEINETEQATSKNQLSSKQLRYYERHKEKINKRRRDNRQQKNIQQKETINEIEQVTTS